MDTVRDIALRAKAASTKMTAVSSEDKNRALFAMACALRDQSDKVLLANSQDMAAAKEANTSESLLDRLLLTDARVEEMASALEDLAALDDPVGRVLEQRELYNGMQLRKVTVPLGVVGIVYEARPNVTADACGICLKSGNTAILRGGSLAANSCVTIAHILHEAAVSAGMPRGCIEIIATTDRSATDELMSLRGIVDVLIPRGGTGLISHCVEFAKIPVIETGTGNCHVYVHASANLSMAHDIVLNAKCRRYGVCNACETLLVDRECAREFLPKIGMSLRKQGVVLHADEVAKNILDACNVESQIADESDWACEYLAPEIAIHIVDGVEQAVEHINMYGTKHSESIIAQDSQAIELFQQCVDASSVYANASTAFTDGGQFGLGAEIGISTQKLHVRGPFALEGLTSYKYLLNGSGQVRS